LIKQFLYYIAVLLLILSGCSVPDSRQDNSSASSTESAFQESESEPTKDADNSAELPVAFPRSQKLDYYLNGNSADYQVDMVVKTYKESVLIQYPRLSGMVDTDLQEIINAKIISIALERYTEDTEVSLEIECEIKLANSRALSAYFYGYSNHLQAAHPNWLMFTINIDIETGKILTFYDLYPQEVYLTDESWVNLIVRQDLFFPFTDEGEELRKAVVDTLHSDKDRYFLALSEELDITGGYYSYFTEDSVGFCLSTYHPIGDFMRCEVPLEEIVL